MAAKMIMQSARSDVACISNCLRRPSLAGVHTGVVTGFATLLDMLKRSLVEALSRLR